MDLFHRGRLSTVRGYGQRGFLVAADALQFAGALRDSIADIVFVDPPFNLGKDYGGATVLENKSRVAYEIYMRHLFREVVRCLKPGGALFLYHIPYWASVFASDLNERLEFRHWIAVAMKNGYVRGKNLYPAHYALLYYTKGKPRRFKRPRVPPSRCRHCNGMVKDYGGYTRFVQRGLNLRVAEEITPVNWA